MEKLCVFFVVALIINVSSGMNLRQKRQSGNEDDLEDRYGWNQPSFPGRFPNQGQFPNRFPNQGQFPNQNQFPNQGQFPNQNQFPNQGQFPNQNQFPNQGQFPNQNQFPNQGQFSNQGQLTNQGQQQQQSTTTTQAPSRTTTQSAAVRQCISSCPVTSEYSPICGSDNVTYFNPGRLSCAQACGVRVTQTRQAPCPAAATVGSTGVVPDLASVG